MKITIKPILTLLLLVLVSACSSDDATVVQEDFVVAFENPSVSFGASEDEKNIDLVFSTAAPENGSVEISFTGTNATYGDTEDFVTVPAAVNGVVTLDIASGAERASFVFKKLKDAVEGTEKSITLEISAVHLSDGLSNGTTSMQVAFEETAALGGQMAPEVGGPNEPNQVYIDLSAQNQSSISREAWDLAFYNGDAFRVAINSSLYMAVAEHDEIDIDAVTAEQVAGLQASVAVGTFDAANTAYVDVPSGDIKGTAIKEVSEVDAANKVYLLNMGSKIGTEEPETGGVNTSGDSRGWMKIRVLRNGNDYTLQYARLEDTTHKEISVSKDAAFNFQFVSLISDTLVSVEPEKDKWDLNFTVFTNEIEGYGSYGYADFVATNSKGEVSAYKVDAESKPYEEFTISDIDTEALDTDQRAIGSSWRNGGGPGTLPSLKEDVFFIVKDGDGNYYKLKFTALVNESGIRGYPAFEYTLLQ
ncbi:HmuY protein [Zobellia uliginosa]|uniref:HmuY protein n=1 Tax=Zobellia uliginosa TaxID=143224 RepID=A0ABY1KNZ3_9FLAO|nr:HmuY family protein [Zobellia uliginosa]SIS53729.1 HmuY protein [Zobellia uliginosa]